jgi:Tfp pilus assembly protein PilF
LPLTARNAAKPEKQVRVTLTIKYNNLISRLALALLAVAIVALGGWVIYTHFLVRALADPRTAFNQHALSIAAQQMPNSARINLRLAETATINADANASQHAAHAVNLAPWNYQAWRTLAVAQEVNGEESAEQSLRTAARLAPHHAEVNWQLANLLLRHGQLDAALAPFRVAVANNNELRAVVYDLLWQASNGDLNTVSAMASNDADAQLALAQFLTEQSRAADAINVFRAVEPRARLASTRTAGFITSLLNTGQYETARALWLEVMGARLNVALATDEPIWNGGYELDALPNLNHFDWTIRPSEYARIGLDRTARHSGERSLKITFIGRDTTRLDGEVKQLLALRPGVSYRLEAYARAADLVTTEGPRLALLKGNEVVATSAPIAAGTTDWQHLTVDFTAPTDNAAKYVAIVRQPKFSYDEPMRGAIWFDDFKLTEQARSKQN